MSASTSNWNDGMIAAACRGRHGRERHATSLGDGRTARWTTTVPGTASANVLVALAGPASTGPRTSDRPLSTQSCGPNTRGLVSSLEERQDDTGWAWGNITRSASMVESSSAPTGLSESSTVIDSFLALAIIASQPACVE